MISRTLPVLLTLVLTACDKDKPEPAALEEMVAHYKVEKKGSIVGYAGPCMGSTERTDTGCAQHVRQQCSDMRMKSRVLGVQRVDWPKGSNRPFPPKPDSRIWLWVYVCEPLAPPA